MSPKCHHFDPEMSPKCHQKLLDGRHRGRYNLCMSDPNPIDIVFFRGLKGAPASILLLLILAAKPINRYTIEAATGYSDKPITTAIALLERSRMIVNSGNGYELAEELRRKVSPSSSSSIEQISLFEGQEEEEETERRKNSEAKTWLIRAGIGRNSPKLREITAADPEPDYIRRWVLYFEWWTREAERYPGATIDGRSRFSVGTLITILLDGDPAPIDRCEQCLEEDRNCYCSIIKR